MGSTQEVQQHTFDETRGAFNALCRIASSLQHGDDEQYLLGDECSFFLVHVVYQAISALITIGQGNPSAEIEERITILRWLLQHLQTRWPLSGKSLSESMYIFITNIQLDTYQSILGIKEALLIAKVI